MIMVRFLIFVVVIALIVYIIWALSMRYANVTKDHLKREDDKLYEKYKKRMESDKRKAKKKK